MLQQFLIIVRYFSHPDLNAQHGSEFLRISAAYQRILNKNDIYDAPRAPRARYNPDTRAYPGSLREHFTQPAVRIVQFERKSPALKICSSYIFSILEFRACTYF